MKFSSCFSFILFLFSSFALCSDPNPLGPQMRKQLILSVQNNDLNEVKKLVNAGVVITSEDESGKCSLHYAISQNNPDMAKALLASKQKYDLNLFFSGDYPLVHYACCYKQNEILELLIDHGASVTMQTKSGYRFFLYEDSRFKYHGWEIAPIHIAIAKGASDCFFTLLKKGASMGSKFTLKSSLCYSYSSEKTGLEFLKKVDKNNNLSAVYKNFQKTKKLVEDELWLSCRKGMTASFKKMIKDGFRLPPKKKKRWFPLHVAAFYGRFEVIKVLVEKGWAQLNEKGVGGLTALHIASVFGKRGAVETLLRLGAPINQITNKFISIGGYCHIEGERIFLHSRYSALGLATRARQKEVVELLVKSGAKFKHREALFCKTYFWVRGSVRSEIRSQLKIARGLERSERQRRRDQMRGFSSSKLSASSGSEDQALYVLGVPYAQEVMM